MKRIFALSCILLFGFCVSCKNEVGVTAAELLGKSFSCNISFSIAETEFTSAFTKAQEKSELTFTSPETVEGFTFEKSENTLTLSYNGIGISVNTEKLPFGSAPSNVLDFYSADINDYTVESRDDGIYLYLNNSGFKVCTVFDTKTLVPLRTFDENDTFEIKYSDYRLL